MKVIEIKETQSTNSWLSAHCGELEGDCLVYALAQTAGRGQRGNSWESEPGKNLTASALLHPHGILPQKQFLISEAVALAVTDFLSGLGVETMVKWPNDIYAGDKKICGILIEHAVMPGVIMRTIAGVGVNINQTLFLSDAPNPVSVKQLTGEDHDIASLAPLLADKISQRLSSIVSTGNEQRTTESQKLHSQFMQKLWRGDSRMYPFFDRNADEKIEAKIINVAPDGILTLETSKGETRSYAFKEIEFLL